MRKVLFYLLFFVYSLPLSAQSAEHQWKAGYNFFTLIGTSLDVLIERNFNESWALVSTLGYTYGTSYGGFIKVDDMIERTNARGAYIKIGGKWISTTETKAKLWGSINFVLSYYKEEGLFFINSNDSKVIYAEGIAPGVALSVGVEYKLISRINLRLGVQKGVYIRNDHLGHSALTYQPGFGYFTNIGTSQGIIALMYKL